MSLESLAASEDPSIGSNMLRDYVERYKRLFNAQSDLRDDVKELSQEAKSNGYDPRAIKLIAKREEEEASAREKREEFEANVSMYKSAISSDW